MVEAASISPAVLYGLVRRLYGGMLTVCYAIVIPLCALAGAAFELALRTAV